MFPVAMGLAEREGPVLLALHHPPAAVGEATFGSMALGTRDRLMDLVQQHPAVRLVVFGHIHQHWHWRGEDPEGSSCVLLGCPRPFFSRRPLRNPAPRIGPIGLVPVR